VLLNTLKEGNGGSSINKHIQVLTVMLIIAAMVFSAFNLPSTKADEQSSWNPETPMPTARGGLGVAVVDGKIYAIGGSSGSDLPLNNNEMYDPVSNSWTVERPMPTARSNFAIAVYNSKIYVIGGTVGNGFVGNNEVYDPSTNMWETKTSMPTPRGDLSASVVNDKIYLIGGKIYSNTNPYFAETNLNEVYDPANDSWTIKSSIPTSVFGYASAVMNGKIYIAGGSTGPITQQSASYTASNQVYDPQTDNWSSAANLPTLTSYGASAATQGYLAPTQMYVVGGYSLSNLSNITQAYNPGNNSWVTGASLSSPIAYLSLAVVNDILYAIGGFDGQNWLNTVEQYNPIGYGTVPPQLQITSPENKTYSKVDLAFTINRGADWIGYSLDNQANITIKEGANYNLLGLSQGSHSIILYDNDSQGNTGYSNMIYFSVDTIPPVIVIMTPQNQSYGSTDMELTFTTNKAVKDLSYSLDGQTNITIVGNVTLPSLLNGSHRLTVYATDLVGNSGSKTIYFNIDPFPFVTIAAVAAIVVIALTTGYLFYKKRSSHSKKEEKNTVA
jgi:N-acetylneuraminic acid mutarotase